MKEDEMEQMLPLAEIAARLKREHPKIALDVDRLRSFCKKGTLQCCRRIKRKPLSLPYEELVKELYSYWKNAMVYERH